MEKMRKRQTGIEIKKAQIIEEEEENKIYSEKYKIIKEAMEGYLSRNLENITIDGKWYTPKIYGPPWQCDIEYIVKIPVTYRMGIFSWKGYDEYEVSILGGEVLSIQAK